MLYCCLKLSVQVLTRVILFLESQRRVWLNQTIKPDKKYEKIIWSPDLHKFVPKGEEVELTVTQYYHKRYGIKLVSVDFCLLRQFPSRSILHLSLKIRVRVPIFQLCTLEGWAGYHLSLLIRVFQRAKKMKMKWLGVPNENQYIIIQPSLLTSVHWPIHRKVLMYYDRVAGINFQKEMENKREELSKVISQGLSKFNLSIAKEQVVVKAKVLMNPSIDFGNSRHANITNGSFNLANGVRFARPAELESFAVVNYTGNEAAPKKFSECFIRILT